MKFWNMTANC